MYLGLKSEDLEQVHLDEINKDYGISSKLTPTEKEYILNKPDRTKNQCKLEI